jgi:hypothetical protein
VPELHPVGINDITEKRRKQAVHLFICRYFCIVGIWFDGFARIDICKYLCILERGLGNNVHAACLYPQCSLPISRI